jgi:hypothetical protein
MRIEPCVAFGKLQKIFLAVLNNVGLISVIG